MPNPIYDSRSISSINPAGKPRSPHIIRTMPGKSVMPPRPPAAEKPPAVPDPIVALGGAVMANAPAQPIQPVKVTAVKRRHAMVAVRSSEDLSWMVPAVMTAAAQRVNPIILCVPAYNAATMAQQAMHQLAKCVARGVLTREQAGTVVIAAEMEMPPVVEAPRVKAVVRARAPLPVPASPTDTED